MRKHMRVTEEECATLGEQWMAKQVYNHLGVLLKPHKPSWLYQRGFRFDLDYRLLKSGLKFVYKLGRYDKQTARTSRILSTTDSGEFVKYVQAIYSLEQ